MKLDNKKTVFFTNKILVFSKLEKISVFVDFRVFPADMTVLRKQKLKFISFHLFSILLLMR